MIYLSLFWEYFKIGLFTIGGGYAMLPMVKQVVLRHGWLAEQQLIDFIGVAESTPGPFAINLATFVGMHVGVDNTSLGVFGGFLGAIIATTAVVLPSIVIIIIVTKLFAKFKQSTAVQGALYGVKPVVVGLILSAAVGLVVKVVLPNLNLAKPTSDGFSQFNWVSLLILLVMFPLSKVKIKGKKVHPILLIVISAVVGVVVFGVCGVQQ